MKKGVEFKLIEDFANDWYMNEIEYNYINNRNKNNRKKCEIFSKLKMKTQERRQLHLSGVFIFNFEHVSLLFLEFLLLNLNMYVLTGNGVI